MQATDYLVVGSGLTGATIARVLADAGRDVTVVDRRSYSAGNVADAVHRSGIRHNLHGPHYFRTSDTRVWEFAQRFSAFRRYEARVLTAFDQKVFSWPLTGDTIAAYAGPDWKPEFTGVPRNFEEQALSVMPRVIYEKAVRPYTELQWGVPAHTLSAALARRFDVRKTDETRLSPHAKHQGMPIAGYSSWVAAILDKIPLVLNHDHLRCRDYEARKKLIFTGPIDEYFGFRYGRLTYRGQKRDYTHRSDIDLFLPAAQVNNPNGPFIRTLEWKRMMDRADAAWTRGTLLTTETPFTPTDPDEYEYPFPDEVNAALYHRYRTQAIQDPKLLVCGRLGENRYYDMDQAIARAIKLGERLLTEN